jgi:hypothetical protein
MKLKFEITEKERHILYRVLAVVLLLTNTVTMWFCGPELDKYITGHLTGVVGFWLVANLILTAVALFKHYR